jgi:RNA recognition motif-containing protein
MEFRLFTSNVPYNCTEEEFRTFMLTFDGVKYVKLVARPSGQINTVNKGFGFVTVTTKEVHDGFMVNDNIVFNGRKLKFIEYVNQQKYYKLHVMNVPETATEQNLFDVFSKFGKVDSVKRDFNYASKQFKGTSVVVYNNYEDFNTVLTMKDVPFSETVTLYVTKRHLPFRRPFRGNYAPRTQNPPQVAK